MEGVPILLCGVREIFYPSRVQDLIEQYQVSSILNVGAKNCLYYPEDLGTGSPPPILNVLSDDDPNSEWPLGRMAVLTEQLVQKAKGEEKALIIHCKEGKSRSVSVLIAYLILKGAFGDVDSCLESIRRKRPIAKPNEGFMVKLGKFVETVPGLRESELMVKPTQELIAEINELCQQ